MILSYAEHGDPSGFPIVGLHGGGATKQHWARVATEGIPERRWICVDQRGHGDSPKGKPPWDLEHNVRDILATLDSLDLDRVDLIGASGGGRIAAELSKSAPSRVRSVVLLDPPIMTPDEFTRFRDHHADALRVREFSDVSELLTLWHKELPASARPYAEQEWAAALEPSEHGGLRLRVDPDVWSAHINDETYFGGPFTFGNFPGDVLLLVADRPIGGRFHAVTDKGLGALRVELGPRLTSTTIDAGHSLLLGAFEEAVAHVTEFLAVQDQEAVVT